MRSVKRIIRLISSLAPLPRWIEPQLCKLVTVIPAGDEWAHEIKFDGFRMHARIVGGATALLTRTGSTGPPRSGDRRLDRRARMPAGLMSTASFAR